VVGGTVCWVHGGNARQVRQKREQRVALYDAQVAAAQDPVVVVQKEPEELLLDVLADTNQVLSAIKSQMQNNLYDPILLQVLGDWIDRLGRLGKVIVDGDLATKLHARLGWLAADRAAVCWALLAAVVAESPLSAQQKSALWQSRFDGLRAVEDSQRPFRLEGVELQRFSDGLLEAAAREQALAEGEVMPWDGEDSESEADVDAPAEDTDSDSGGSVLPFPAFGSV
jgi:hypothetical protein